MIYMWEIPECPNKHIAAYNEAISTDRFIFMQGKPVTKEEITKPLIFELKITQAEIMKYDAIPNNSSSPLVNQKIVNILQELAPEDVQFFDAEIRCKDGDLKDYKLLNIARSIEGIDHEKSIYRRDKFAGLITIIKYLTYLPNCMKNYKLGRDKELIGNILVTEEIKQAFENAKIKRLRIVRPEEYYSAMVGEI